LIHFFKRPRPQTVYMARIQPVYRHREQRPWIEEDIFLPALRM